MAAFLALSMAGLYAYDRWRGQGPHRAAAEVRAAAAAKQSGRRTARHAGPAAAADRRIRLGGPGARPGPHPRGPRDGDHRWARPSRLRPAGGSRPQSAAAPCGPRLAALRTARRARRGHDPLPAAGTLAALGRGGACPRGPDASRPGGGNAVAAARRTPAAGPAPGGRGRASGHAGAGARRARGGADLRRLHLHHAVRHGAEHGGGIAARHRAAAGAGLPRCW